MKLSLTPEADSVNVQALNMGRIVVDVDGINLAELINKVAENGYSLRVVDESDQQSTCTHNRLRLFPAYAAVPHISRKRTTPGCTRCYTRPVTLVNQNGFILPVPVICYVPSSGRHTHPALWCQSHSSGCQCQMSARFTHFRLVIRKFTT